MKTLTNSVLFCPSIPDKKTQKNKIFVNKIPISILLPRRE